MVKKMKKRVKRHKENITLTRKQQRKQTRKEKKVRRNEFFTKRKGLGQTVVPTVPNKESLTSSHIKSGNQKEKLEKNSIDDIKSTNKVLSTEQLRRKEKREQLKIQKEMAKQRNKQLIDANHEEDRNIKQLEKQLKLNKRKTKSIPKSFLEDGLDYLLQVCDSEAMKNAVATEQELNEVNDEFEEDFALMTGKAMKNEDDDIDESDSDDTEALANELGDDSDESFNSELSLSENGASDEKQEEEKTFNVKKRKLVDNFQVAKKVKSNSSHEDPTNKETTVQSSDEEQDLNSFDDVEAEIVSCNSEDEVENDVKGAVRKYPNGTWEDIYGRLRAKDGTVLNVSSSIYTKHFLLYTSIID